MSEKKPAEDAVNPRHYADLGWWSAVAIIRKWNEHRAATGGKPVSFDVGNALKYMQRAGTKPGESEVTDLKKAAWYLAEAIHVLDPSEPDPAGLS